MLSRFFGLTVYYNGNWWEWSGYYSDWFLLPQLVEKPSSDPPYWTPFFGFVKWVWSW